MISQDWLGSVGGWAGLMQGSAEAVLSVIVAVLTAWAILLGTRHHERGLADELDAKAAGRELITALTDAGLAFDTAKQAQDAEALGQLTIRLAGAGDRRSGVCGEPSSSVRVDHR